ncbi:MAG: hypothetical protein ACYCU7_14590 [Acidimicrobiales bacterium]
MTQPAFVPIAEPDQVRPALRLETPRRWVAGRPAEVAVPRRPGGPMDGTPGPDQGYALMLARRATPRLALADGEQAADVELGVALLAARRAGSFGRAPSAPDVRAILALWGFVADQPPEGLVDERRRAFQGVSHDYTLQRALVGRVPEESLHLSPEQVEGRVAAGDWRELVGLAPGDHPSTEGPTASPGEPAATG